MSRCLLQVHDEQVVLLVYLVPAGAVDLDIKALEEGGGCDCHVRSATGYREDLVGVGTVVLQPYADLAVFQIASSGLPALSRTLSFLRYFSHADMSEPSYRLVVL